MRVWSGWGILVPVFNLVAFIMSAMLISIMNLASDESFALALGLCGLLAGAAIFVTTRAIETEPGIEQPSAGAFLHIPTRVWSVISPCGGLAMAFLTLASSSAAAV